MSQPAQHARETLDTALELAERIATTNKIHEGTHGVQAADLLGRKLYLRDRGGLASGDVGTRV